LLPECGSESIILWLYAIGRLIIQKIIEDKECKEVSKMQDIIKSFSQYQKFYESHKAHSQEKDIISSDLQILFAKLDIHFRYLGIIPSVTIGKQKIPSKFILDYTT